MRLRDGALNATTLTEISSIGGDKKGTCPLKSGNKAVKDITNQLKDMKASELNGQEAKDLIERRDLEDVLYS